MAAPGTAPGAIDISSEMWNNQPLMKPLCAPCNKRQKTKQQQRKSRMPRVSTSRTPTLRASALRTVAWRGSAWRRKINHRWQAHA